MKKLFLLLLFSITTVAGLAQNRFWVSAVPSNWNNVNNWSTTSNGAGGASVPTTGNLAFFNGAGGKNGSCLVDISPTVTGITVNGYTGTIDLLGQTLTTTGTNIFTTGTIANTGAGGTLAINNTTLLSTFNGTSFSSASVTGTTGNLALSGSTFGSTVDLTKANTGNDTGTGNNTFNSAVTITNTTTANLTLGNANKDTYNSTLTVNCNGTGQTSINAGGATTHLLNGNVVVNYTSTGTVYFGSNNGASTLASGKTITVGTVGGTGPGNLTLSKFTTSTTAQNISMAGNLTGIVTFIGSTFAGPLTVNAPGILFTTSTFSAASTFTKTGSTTDTSTGGNTFTTATFNNPGTGPFELCNTSPDTFNGATVFNNTGTSRMQIGISAAGIVFNGNLTINHGGTTAGINFIFCRNASSTMTINGTLTLNQSNTDPSSGIIVPLNGAVTCNGNIIMSSVAGRGVFIGGDATTSTGTVTLANGFTISDAGAGTFTTGTMWIKRLTQVGGTAQSFGISGNAVTTIESSTVFNGALTITNTGATTLNLGTPATYNGAFTAVAPTINLNGSTYNGVTSIEKNGSTNDSGTGGNTFGTTTTLTNSGSGFFLTANSNPDTFNGDVTLTNTGSNALHVAYAVPGTQFNQNIIVNCVSGTGIFFSNNSGGASTQAAGKTITVGASGFTVGQLSLKRFTQNAPVNLTLTGLAALRIGPNSSFGNTFTGIAPQFFLDGATYTGAFYGEKNGPGNSNGAGGNTWNSTASLVNSGSGYFMTGNTTADTFNGDLTTNNKGSDGIYLSHNAPGTLFNGNIIVNATSGIGTYFSNNSLGSATLASGKTVTVGPSNYFSGELSFLRFTQTGTSTPQTITLTGTSLMRQGAGTTWNSNVTFVSPQLFLDGATFNGVTYLEKNGATNNTGAGSNTFNSTATIVQNGSGVLRTNGGNIFNGTTTLTNTGSADMLLENLFGGTYAADVTFSSTGSSSIRTAFAGNTTYGGNLIFNCTSTAGIYFGEAAGATATLASGKLMSVGGTGFNNGELKLQRFTENGTTAQSLVLTGIGSIRLGLLSTFGGNVDFRAPQVYMDGAVYNGTAYIEKTGPTGNTGAGNNTFNSTATIVNSGSSNLRTNGNNVFNSTTTITNSSSSDILLENVSGNTYQGDVTISNTGSDRIRMTYAGVTAFNGNMIVNSTGGTGVQFGETTGTATLATGKTITVGGIGFTNGTLLLKSFTQVGPTAQNLILTTNSILQLGPASTFNGNVNFKGPQLYLQGATYNGTTALEKTGAVTNASAGGNIFNGVTTLINSGSSPLQLAKTALDQFNNDLTATNSGTSNLALSDQFAGSAYAGNITVNGTLGGGVFFGNTGGTSTLAAGKTISVGGMGFTIGELKLQAFTQNGATNQTIALTGNADIRVGPLSAFNGNVDFRAPQVFLDGATYNGTAYLEKNGAGNNTGLGNNTFASTTTIVSSSSGYLRTNGNNLHNGTTTLINSGTNELTMEFVNGSIYNADATLSNTGSSFIRTSTNGATQFNGNIIVNSLNATGIYFCDVAGTATLATGKTISVGATGFSAGELRIQRFTQVGTTAQSLTLTGSAIFRSALATTWNGNITVTSPTIFLDGSTYNGTAIFAKNGNSSDNSAGGNTFNATTTFSNSGTGIFRLANVNGDAFNSSANFFQTSGTIQPAYVATSTITGDLAVTSITPIIFSGGGGNLTFSGSAAQSIVKGSSASPTFTRLVMNKPAGVLTLNTDILIATAATFTNGVIMSTTTNFINFAAGSSATGASNASYVDGPVRKTGNTAFGFPTGNAGIYRAIAISALTGSDVFTAQYFKAAQAFGGPPTYAATLSTVSSCEYWTLTRAAAVNASVTLSWNSPDCTGTYITDLTKLRVSRWNNTNWLDLGNSATTGTTTTGTITSGAVVTAFGPFTLASTSKANPLPIELLSFTGVTAEADVQLNWVTASELNNDYFEVQRSTDNYEYVSLTTIGGAGTSNQEHSYDYLDKNPGSGILYYRLRQVDLDGKSTFSDVVKIVPGEIRSLTAWPNPSKNGGVIQLNYTGSYQVYNSFGHLVGKLEKVNKLDTSGLSAGVYMLRADNGMIVRVIVE